MEIRKKGFYITGKILLICIFVITVLSFGENIELKDLKLHKFRTGGVVGESYNGVDYILNNENNRQIIMYFRKTIFRRFSTGDYSYVDTSVYKNKDFLMTDFFNKNNLDMYYSRDFIELKSGEKFLYGKIVLENYSDYLKLELYFIDKNDEEKKKVFFKEFDRDILFSNLDKINNNRIEGYYSLPYFTEELTLFTRKKIIHKKVKYSGYNETKLTEAEKNLYNYLLNLFKDEIPEEFFE